MDLASNDMIKVRFKSIDLAKFICAILVVIIHCSPFKNLNDNINSFFTEFICRIAVPFYFLCSSYFLFRKKTEKESFKKYILNMTKLYLIWTIVYLPQIIYVDIIKSEKILIYKCIDTIKDLFFGYHFLWYFIATIWGTCLIYFFSKKMNYRIIFLLSCILYIIATLCSTYYFLSIKIIDNNDLLKNIFDFFGDCNNTFMFSTIFICIGYMFANVSFILEEKKCNVLLFFWTIIFFTEYFFVKKYNIAKGFDMYFSLIPVVSLIFYKIILMDRCLKSVNIYSKLREYGIYIFYIHKWIVFLTIGLLNFLGWNYNTFNLMLFFLVLIFCFITIVGIKLLSKKYIIFNNFFKKIFS